MGRLLEKDHFRKDIQAFRAIAVLLVLVYHVWPDAMPGGFIGVDVFFVISGFLITSLLMRELETSGTISFSRFYARRARRLLPASLLVLLIVLVVTAGGSPKIFWPDVAGEVAAAALYFENWWLHFQALDYLAGTGSPSPVQHFWSLSVEEQFYFAWPLVMLAAYGLAKRARSIDSKVVIASALAAIVVLSLLWSVWQGFFGAPGSDYFSTWSRVWQLGIGGLLALSGMSPRGGRGLLILVIGLTGVLASGVLVGAEGAYPGWRALIPTLAAAACLSAGQTFDSAGVTKWLGASPVQWIGNVSYSLYLWHWPVVIFAKKVVSGENSLVVGVVLIGISFLLAGLSKRWIEDGFRLHSGQSSSSRRPLLAALMGSLGVVLLAGGMTWSARGAPARDVEGYPGARALMPGSAYIQKPDDYVPALVSVERDVADAYAQGCIQQVEGDDVLRCVYGRDDAKRKIAVVGDSHAVHWLPAFQELVKDYDIQVIGMTKTSCPFSAAAVIHSGLKRDYDACVRWSQRVVNELVASDIKYVVVSQSPRYRMSAAPTDQSVATGLLSAGMLKVWEPLRAVGKVVLPIRSTPWQGVVMRECAARNPWPFDACAGDQNKVLYDSAIPVAARKFGSNMVDLTPYFCVDGKCPAIIGGVFVYRDNAHITATYMRSLAPALRDALSEVRMPRRLHVEHRPVLPDVASLSPAVADAQYDRGDAFDKKCLQNEGVEPVRCDFEIGKARPRVVIVGDGMAANLVPGFVGAAKLKGWQVTTFVKDSCLFSARPVFNRSIGGAFEDCVRWSDNVKKELVRLKPDIVLQAQSYIYRRDVASSPEVSREELAEGILEVWRPLQREGVHLVAVDYTPLMSANIPECLMSDIERKGGCFALASAAQRTGALTLASKAMGRKMLLLNDQFCTAEFCPPQRGGILIYRDAMQPTATFMRSISPIIANRVSTAMASMQ